MARNGVITLEDRMDYQVWMTFTGQDARIVAVRRHGAGVTVTFGLRDDSDPHRYTSNRGHMFALHSG